MDEKYSELEPARAARLAEVLNGQSREAIDAIHELDRRLTQTNFLTNGGAAAATLALLAGNIEPQVVYVPLAFFVTGLVATGLEIRYLMKYWAVLFKDATRRHRGFMADELTVKEAGTTNDSEGKLYQAINHWAGVVAQSTFVLGALVGAYKIVCSAM